MKPEAARGTTRAEPAISPMEPSGAPPLRRRRWARLRWIAAAAALLAIGAAGFVAYDRYQTARLANPVRRAFAERRYDEARGLLQRWIEARPQSAEAQYFRAWLALADNRAAEAADSIKRAMMGGFDRESLEVLQAIFQARGGHINDVEPILRRAYEQDREPRAEIARELARILLATYRLTQAAAVVERYRELMPSDPQPYLWRNEIGSRTKESPSVLIRNYRAALERDPNLDKARLGLAEQLSKDRRFDEAEEEYLAYLKRNPRDTKAMVGLGRNAFQNGDIAAASRHFEAALAVDARQPDALKELSQLDIRFGRVDQACRRLKFLTQVEPFEPDYRYSYAQALKLAGRLDQARIESERAAQLRNDQERILRLQTSILNNPGDLASRLEIARWMLEHGHGEEGLKWTREILRVDPRHAPTHRALAEYYASHGDPGLANYHRAMAAGGHDPE